MCNACASMHETSSKLVQHVAYARRRWSFIRHSYACHNTHMEILNVRMITHANTSVWHAITHASTMRGIRTQRKQHMKFAAQAGHATHAHHKIHASDMHKRVMS